MAKQKRVSIELSALDRMMPMHVVVGPDDVIVHAGPTLEKTCPAGPLAGQKFFDVFELRRGQPETRLRAACASADAKLYLRLNDTHRTQLIGTATLLPEQDQMLVNLSFGISVIDAVGRHNLAGSDFAPTDLTLELLYLVEAKSAAMEESKQLNQRLNGAWQAAEADAASDMLTGLKNRRVLDQVLRRLIRRNLSFTLMHLDLDFFKMVNDTLGHAAGDHVLKEVARILIAQTRECDTIARVGGDEFVLILHGTTDPERLMRVANRMISCLEQPIAYQNETCRISASIGMAASTSYDRPDAAQMLEDADRALYASKDKGRACATLHQAHGETPATRAALPEKQSKPA